MQYLVEAADRLAEIVLLIRRLDEIGEQQASHRLDGLEPVAARLEQIANDLAQGMLASATRRTSELNARLIDGFSGIDDPKYRSTLAAALGRYRRKATPAQAQLGGLRGGRPRKDGRPTRTLESKGYTAATLPDRKPAGARVHPENRPERS
jgi:hypothetical protein